MAAYALSIYEFRGKTFALVFVIGTLLIPLTIILVPVFYVVSNFGMVNSLWGVILPGAATPTGVFLLRQYMLTLPRELIEAARAEGATEWIIYRKIILPCIIPALAALGVLEFTFIWNDYFWALVLTQGDAVKPITVGLDVLRGQWTTSWNLVSAGSVVAALPPVIMFFILQKQFIHGLTFGAVKG